MNLKAKKTENNEQAESDKKTSSQKTLIQIKVAIFCCCNLVAVYYWIFGLKNSEDPKMSRIMTSPSTQTGFYGPSIQKPEL